MKYFLISLLLMSCTDKVFKSIEDNTICIYSKRVSTNALEIEDYQFERCLDDIYLRPEHYTLAIDCNCPERP